MLTILGIVVCVLAVGSQAGATLFTFEGQDEGGIGSATMDLLVSGNTLQATVNNTSPIFCLDPDSNEPNTPGIVAFGFDVVNDPLPGISNWSMTAYAHDGDTFTLEDIAQPSGKWDLLIDGKLEGIEVDYIPNNSEGDTNIDGALYNPLAVGSTGLPGGSNTVYYTTAILEIVFDSGPLLDTSGEWSPYVRMQRVGLDGEGSLKLPGEEDGGGGGGGNPLPEPATMLLLVSGLAGLAATRWKKQRNS